MAHLHLDARQLLRQNLQARKQSGDNDEDLELSKHGKNLLDRAAIRKLLRKPACCSFKCSMDKELFSEESIVTFRRRFAEMNQKEQRAALASLDGVREHEKRVQARTAANTGGIHVKDKHICIGAFKRLFGISHRVWKKVRHLAVGRATPMAHEGREDTREHC